MKQILITITDEDWDDEAQEELISKIDYVTYGMLFREDYTIQEFTK